MVPVMRTRLSPRPVLAAVATLAVAAALAAAPGAPRAEAARDAAAPALREASALAGRWGRCPTSRPAHAALRRAVAAPPRLRPVRARTALRAWRTVVRECGAPVAMPAADPAA
jgi:hypothetical protein